jgi:hypothetical protein
MIIPNPHPTDLEDELGALAMRFRSAGSEQERQAISKDYAKTVERLIQSHLWDEMPASEDQLPDDYMPESFFKYWLPPA